MNSSRVVTWVAPSSISTLPNVLWKPSASNRVSAIHRCSAMPSLRSLGDARLSPLPGAGRGWRALEGRETLRALAAQQLAHRQTLGVERLAQHRHALVRIGLAAHEDV